jgi:hypothetical protein
MQTWSSAWGDFNNDGFMDVYVGASSDADGGSKLMKNNGDGSFSDVTENSGVSEAPNGIENAPGDFNNDGYIDILSNGSILLNNGDMSFSVFSQEMPGPGGIGDVNNDGFLDVFNGSLMVNNGNNNNWITISTIGMTAALMGSNSNGIGARIEITTENIGTQIRDVQSGTGFRYMSSLNTHFGLGEDTQISEITVYWPSGIIDVINSADINQHLIINEGETLSNDNYSSDELIIYPNPVENKLSVKSEFDLINSIYSVFDIQGKRILNNTLVNNEIDVSALSSGQYILRIISNKNITTQKFMKK